MATKIKYNVVHGRPVGKDSEGATIYKNMQVGVVMEKDGRFLLKLNYLPAEGSLFFNLWKPKAKAEPKPEPKAEVIADDGDDEAPF